MLKVGVLRKELRQECFGLTRSTLLWVFVNQIKTETDAMALICTWYRSRNPLLELFQSPGNRTSSIDHCPYGFDAEYA